MNYFADFDRHVIGERNEGIRREVRTKHLEGRLRECRRTRSGRGSLSLTLANVPSMVR